MIIKIGYEVSTRHGDTQVQHLEYCEEGEKDGGIDIEYFNTKAEDAHRVLVDLDNGHWCRGNEIRVID